MNSAYVFYGVGFRHNNEKVFCRLDFGNCEYRIYDLEFIPMPDGRLDNISRDYAKDFDDGRKMIFSKTNGSVDITGKFEKEFKLVHPFDDSQIRELILFAGWFSEKLKEGQLIGRPEGNIPMGFDASKRRAI